MGRYADRGRDMGRDRDTGMWAGRGKGQDQQQAQEQRQGQGRVSQAFHTWPLRPEEQEENDKSFFICTSGVSQPNRGTPNVVSHMALMPFK